MSTKFIFSTAIALFLGVACHSSKKQQASAITDSNNTTVAAPTPSTPTSPFSRPAGINSVHAPGIDEISAMQSKFPGIKSEVLTQGYQIYTGTCTSCHNAKNIYKFTEAEWPNIIADMAPRSKLNDTDKDAVYKYVMSIKATQP